MPLDDAAPDITRLLRESANGSADARERVAALLYAELHRQARHHRHRMGAGQTLDTTALLHETWLRLSGGNEPDWQDRAHYFRMAGRVMRNVLVDHARRRLAAKRGGGAAVAEGVEPDDLPAVRDDEVVAVHEALERLEAFDPRQARVVELRYFVGLDVEETAAALGVSAPTVKRDWAMARAWLQREIERGA
ncbi:MAG: ECF-type sigma factor [Candidatus Eisenbacteria bacterium]